MSETRKLVAILVADVVGYSRLAGADEDRTLSRLPAYRYLGRALRDMGNPSRRDRAERSRNIFAAGRASAANVGEGAVNSSPTSRL